MVDNMEWFNVFGLIFIAVIMIPNVVQISPERCEDFVSDGVSISV